jgi:hypothetical protein
VCDEEDMALVRAWQEILAMRSLSTIAPLCRFLEARRHRCPRWMLRAISSGARAGLDESAVAQRRVLTVFAVQGHEFCASCCASAPSSPLVAERYFADTLFQTAVHFLYLFGCRLGLILDICAKSSE